jgi:Fic family protein
MYRRHQERLIMLFEAESLTRDERLVVDEIEKLQDALRYALRTPPRWFGVLRRNIFARNIRASTTIEGHNISLEDAIAAVENEEPLVAKGIDWLANKGYCDAMTYVLQLAKRTTFAYSADQISSLHYMMLSYAINSHPGNWRPGPISVVDEAKRSVVYEGPDAELVPELIGELVGFLNNFDGHHLVCAAMAHLNLVMIHPFADGNGRMGRCLQSLVLARSLDIVEPTFANIEHYIGQNTRAYYDVLAEVGQGNWATARGSTAPWMRFCLRAHYAQAMSIRRRMRFLQRLWEQLELVTENYGLPERTKFAMSDAAHGLRVRNATYRNAADVSGQVASRDLSHLVQLGLLDVHGRARAASYTAGEEITQIAAKCTELKIASDPFDVVIQRGRTEQTDFSFSG